MSLPRFPFNTAISAGLLAVFATGITVGALPLLAQSEDPAPSDKAPITTTVQVASPSGTAQMVSPLDLVKSPEDYLKANVVFDGTFTSFSNLGLDYPKAERDGNDYITVLIRRPDVAHHTIPLAELKLFLSRKDSDSIQDLESGDDVRIEGTVFSAALGDPWVDITAIKITQKAKLEGKS